MSFRRNLVVITASIVASKHSIASSAGAAVVGVWMTPALGFDPWTWIMGAIGGIIIRAKLPPTNRVDSMVNGVISVMLAGLAAPVLLDAFMAYTEYKKLNHMTLYLTSFMLAVAWPWAIRLGWVFLKSKVEKWSA